MNISLREVWIRMKVRRYMEEINQEFRQFSYRVSVRRVFTIFSNTTFSSHRNMPLKHLARGGHILRDRDGRQAIVWRSG